MRHLLLLRHAKSSLRDVALRDHDRALNSRGRRAAMSMAGHLAKCPVQPSLALCSTARRVRETWSYLRDAFESEPRVCFEESLYLASWETLLERVQGIPDAIQDVLLIGHNPGLEELASRLAVRGPAALRRELAREFPTAALARLALPLDGWRDAGSAGTLVEFTRPRDLPDW